MFTTSMTPVDVVINFLIAIVAGWFLLKLPKIWNSVSELWAERSSAAAARKLKRYEEELAEYKEALQDPINFQFQANVLLGRKLEYVAQATIMAVLSILLMLVDIIHIVDPTGRFVPYQIKFNLFFVSPPKVIQILISLGVLVAMRALVCWDLVHQRWCRYVAPKENILRLEKIIARLRERATQNAK